MSPPFCRLSFFLSCLSAPGLLLEVVNKNPCQCWQAPQREISLVMKSTVRQLWCFNILLELDGVYLTNSKHGVSPSFQTHLPVVGTNDCNECGCTVHDLWSFAQFWHLKDNGDHSSLPAHSQSPLSPYSVVQNKLSELILPLLCVL